MQRWAEDSGNAALMGRELPPAEVLAADQRITAWARQLKAAGLDGDMDIDRYPTGHQPTAGIQHINVPDRCLRRVGNWCASRPLTCGSNRLIDDRQVRAYVGGLPVFAVDRIRVRAPMSADERQSADALGRLEAVSLYE